MDVAVAAHVVVIALVNGNVHVAVIAHVIERNPHNVGDTWAMLQFQRLDVYQRSIDFLAFARRVRMSLGKGNADLADQICRAAESIPQNIAEGAGRASRADKARFFTIARGSAMESAGHLDVLRVEELIDNELYGRGIELLERIVAMLTKLIDP